MSKQWMPLAFPSRWLVPVIRTEERGSDVSLGAYLLLDAFNHESDFAIVVTNDSDLRELIELVQAPPFEMPVWVINPHRKKAAALKPSHHLDLHRDDVRSCQFPRVMAATNGRSISKPDAW